MSNIITIAAENEKNDKKKKKGEGIHEVLSLMKELMEFQERVQECIDAQAITQNKEKLEAFYDNLDSMSQVLLEITETGLKSKRSQEAPQVVPEKSASVTDYGKVSTPFSPKLIM